MTALAIIVPLALLAIVLIATVTLRKVADLEQAPPRKIGRPDSPAATTTNTHLATDQFEAMTYCPSCGAYGPHLMREPRRESAADIEAWERRRREFFDRKLDDIRTMTVASWGGGTVRTITDTLNFREPQPFDESEYTTIRVCECGTQWGQI
ncbi:hypothetical protein GS575_09485 [Rhodococcus hoagii]|nr:hypothetical protein [Prescottella equi]